MPIAVTNIIVLVFQCPAWNDEFAERFNLVEYDTTKIAKAPNWGVIVKCYYRTQQFHSSYCPDLMGVDAGHVKCLKSVMDC